MTTAVVAVIISGVVCILNLISFIITRKKDTKQIVTEDVLKIEGIKESLLKVNMKLDQVCATTVETRTDIKAMGSQLQEMDKRITIIENETQTVWRRIDELRTEINNLKEA